MAAQTDRLDYALVRSKAAKTLTQARKKIRAGSVKVCGYSPKKVSWYCRTVRKPATALRRNVRIIVEPYEVWPLPTGEWRRTRSAREIFKSRRGGDE